MSGATCPADARVRRAAAMFLWLTEMPGLLAVAEPAIVQNHPALGDELKEARIELVRLIQEEFVLDLGL